MKKRFVLATVIVALSIVMPLPAKWKTQNIDKEGVDCRRTYLPVGGWTCPEVDRSADCWCVTQPTP